MPLTAPDIRAVSYTHLDVYKRQFQDNAGSARVLSHAGFEYLGDAETYSVARSARVPTWTYIRRLD